MPRIVIDVGTIVYDKDACDKLLSEMRRQRDVALTSTPPNYAQAVILAHLVGWMTYVIDNLWPADEEPQQPMVEQPELPGAYEPVPADEVPPG